MESVNKLETNVLSRCQLELDLSDRDTRLESRESRLETDSSRGLTRQYEYCLARHKASGHAPSSVTSSSSSVSSSSSSSSSDSSPFVVYCDVIVSSCARRPDDVIFLAPVAREAGGGVPWLYDCPVELREAREPPPARCTACRREREPGGRRDERNACKKQS